MQVWEQVLMGMAALLLVFFFWPGAQAAMERSRRAEKKDWRGVLAPIGLVVLFVIALIILARIRT